MKVIVIGGVGPGHAATLIGAGVRTTDGLLKRGGSRSGRKELASATGIDEATILRWVNHVDLMRIRGVGSQFADLLEAAGVDSIRELATRRPDNLHAKLLEANAQKKLVRRAPSLPAVESWVSAAKVLPAVVSH